MILVSSCLVGNPCRYDGASKKNENICKFLADKTEGVDYILVCPELAADLPIPRPPGEIEKGNAKAVLDGQVKIKSQDGQDYTQAFLKGAEAICKLAKDHQAEMAILKEKSPSCGVSKVYDGSFSGKVIPGQGLTALMLHKMGLKLCTEEDF